MVCLDPDTIMPWCQHHGIAGSYKEAVMDPRVNEMVLKDIEQIAKQDKVASFKIPKDLIIEVRHGLGAIWYLDLQLSLLR